MTGYIVRRLGQAIIVALGVTLLTAILLHLLNGATHDIVQFRGHTYNVGVARRIEGSRASIPALVAFTTKYGLDQNVFLQFWKIVVQIFGHGYLGFSFQKNQTVNAIFSEDIAKDLLLGVISLVLATAIAIPTGIAQAVKRNTSVDYVGTGLSFLFYAMPQYWVGAILILIFAIDMKIFPSGVNANAQSFTGLLQHPNDLVLPVITLTISIYALFSRYMRSSALDVLAQDYMRTARAKGLSERLVLSRHLLRNSLVTVITLLGVSIPGILTAGLIIEQVFNYPGIGLEYFQAAKNSDFLELIGMTFIVGLVTVFGNLLADIGYAVLDPRVRY